MKTKLTMLCMLLLVWLPQELPAVTLVGLYTMSKERRVMVKTDPRDDLFRISRWSLREIYNFSGGSQAFVESTTRTVGTNVIGVNQIVYTGVGYEGSGGSWYIDPVVGYEISPPAGRGIPAFTNVIDVSSYPGYDWYEESMVGTQEFRQGNTKTTITGSMSFVIYNRHVTNFASRVRFFFDSDQGEFEIESRDTTVGAGAIKIFAPTIGYVRRATGRNNITWFRYRYSYDNASWPDTP